MASRPPLCRALVEKLDFVTAAGKMSALVTPLAVFHRPTVDGARFAVASWNPATTVEEIIMSTGFSSLDARETASTPEMTDAEGAALELLDPTGEFAAQVRA